MGARRPRLLDTPSEACEATEIEALMGLFAILPWVVLLATLAWMIVRIRRRLRIWWVPLVTGALPPASLFLSMLLTPP
ncbi:hypothetical protein UQW22_00365 [Isoptericola halotolerans]|uniref:hypothetical protein n=1 Tax=Isoptericola halotolerans TaxID=300560 RepID=UPI00388D5FCA